MRSIEIKKDGNELVVFIGKVDQDGRYQIVRVTQGEAAALIAELSKIID